MACCATKQAFLPPTITAGLNFQSVADVAEFPAPAWDAVLYLRGPQSITINATDSGATHVFDAAGAVTATWQPGKYWYVIRVTSGTSVEEIGSGEIIVAPDIAQASAGYDGRTPNEIALDNIDAVLQKRATLDQQRYKINNRELWRESIPNLMRLRAYYGRLVAREKNKGRGRSAFGRPIEIRFSNK